MSSLVIVDYGMANLRSVQKAFEKFGHPALITSDPNRVAVVTPAPLRRALLPVLRRGLALPTAGAYCHPTRRTRR